MRHRLLFVLLCAFFVNGLCSKHLNVKIFLDCAMYKASFFVRAVILFLFFSPAPKVSTPGRPGHPGFPISVENDSRRLNCSKHPRWERRYSHFFCHLLSFLHLSRPSLYSSVVTPAPLCCHSCEGRNPVLNLIVSIVPCTKFCPLCVQLFCFFSPPPAPKCSTPGRPGHPGFPISVENDSSRRLNCSKRPQWERRYSHFFCHLLSFLHLSRSSLLPLCCHSCEGRNPVLCVSFRPGAACSVSVCFFSSAFHVARPAQQTRALQE